MDRAAPVETSLLSIQPKQLPLQGILQPAFLLSQLEVQVVQEAALCLTAFRDQQGKECLWGQMSTLVDQEEREVQQAMSLSHQVVTSALERLIPTEM